MEHLSTTKLILAAVAALLIGVMIYLVDRQADVYFLSGLALPAISLPPLFGELGRHLPSALHVYAFILLTVVCLPRGRRYLIAACSSWLMLEWLFEFGQHPQLQHRVAALIPRWFDGLPLLEASETFFINGRFDPFDDPVDLRKRAHAGRQEEGLSGGAHGV